MNPNHIEPTPEHFARAKVLLDMGYYQVSRKYRTVARLPPGKTGREALFEADPSWQNREIPEAAAANQYLSVYAKDKLTLDPGTFNAFMKTRTTYQRTPLDELRDLQRKLTQYQFDHYASPRVKSLLNSFIAMVDAEIVKDVEIPTASHGVMEVTFNEGKINHVWTPDRELERK